MVVVEGKGTRGIVTPGLRREDARTRIILGVVALTGNLAIITLQTRELELSLTGKTKMKRNEVAVLCRSSFDHAWNRGAAGLLLGYFFSVFGRRGAGLSHIHISFSECQYTCTVNTG